MDDDRYKRRDDKSPTAARAFEPAIALSPEEIATSRLITSDLKDEIRMAAGPRRMHEAVALTVKAVHHFSRDEIDEAVDFASQAKKLAPRSSVVREVLALVLYEAESWHDAAAAFAAYRRLSGRPDADHLYADCERALGRPERALEILDEESKTKFPMEILIERLLVRTGSLSALGRTDEALALLRPNVDSGGSLKEHDLRRVYAYADLLETVGRAPEAREWWDLIWATDPEFFDVADRRLGV